eukprot:CAMPEP_0179071272 /NCGR_PEP_ID=MMETSP0796-20121207/31447_1 /TAXON_ID=73915 /ORGANISM="Pyrodinium bahamense, Strain pbaha01" /LENGTH=724 /DNA_ID=CAMNT_0020768383 /DNA_START=96 /DNA_END=2270 /DNA_ORIENTATION=+
MTGQELRAAKTMPASTRRQGKKKTLSKWSSYSAVSWRRENEKDFTEHEKTIMESSAWHLKAWSEFQRWLLPALVGVLTASSGAVIEKAVDYTSSLRSGYCATHLLYSKKTCGDWVAYADVGYPYMMYVGVSCGLVFIAALLVRFVAPTARGSGIPEVKTILGGFIVTDVLSLKTLVTKIIGLGFSVGAGLSCGKEGPLVHIACCWSNNLAYLFPRWRRNEAKRRELLSTAAAAGVSVAFGAPLGGVLFSFEEVSTMFPMRTMVLAFWAATVAALTLSWWDVSGTGRLTLFHTAYNTPPVGVEYIGIIFLGIVGGLLGAVFVHYNMMICAGRAKGTPWRKRVPEVFEVVLICFCTAVTNYPNEYARVLSSTSIRSLFHSCADTNPTAPDMMSLCNGMEPKTDLILSATLVLGGLLRFVQMWFTFGSGVPAGLFVPCLYTGACLGRVVGFVAHRINASIPNSHVVVNPGVYAMVGAASVLGGACRVTISLVVIMFELTDGLQMVVPFMCACLISKFVGDYFTGGIYDCAIKLRGYPYLHEPDEPTFHMTAKDVMDDQLEVIDCEPHTVGDILTRLRLTSYSGFPLVRSHTLDRTLVGYLHTTQVIQHLESQLRENQLVSEGQQVHFRQAHGCSGLDLSKLVDVTVYRVVQEMPVKEVHEMFRKLGIKIILVEECGKLAGMITKKSFIDHIDEIERQEVEGVAPRDFTGNFESNLERPLLSDGSRIE